MNSISFADSDSPFFMANKQFCNEMVASLAPAYAEFTGECTSYGYRVTAQFTRGHLTWEILFLKAQFTQNGVIVPKDSNEYAGTQFRISGLPANYKISLGRGRIRRLFTRKEFKAALPSPFFLYANHPSPSNLVGQIIPFVTGNEIDSIRIKRGKALIRIHKPLSNPMPVIEQAEAMLCEIS